MIPFLHEMWDNMEKGNSGRQQITLMTLDESFDLGVNASSTLRGFTVKDLIYNKVYTQQYLNKPYAILTA